MIGKFQIAASFAVIYVYAGELMPTVVRSEAMGISSFVAGIGLLLFPYINALVSFAQILMYIHASHNYRAQSFTSLKAD